MFSVTINCPETLFPLKLIQFIYENELKIVYLNVEIVLRIFVSTPVTNCSAERSFLCLKRIKNYQRSTMSQQRLNALAISCIENHITADIKFEDIIKTFAEQKSKKWVLFYKKNHPVYNNIYINIYLFLYRLILYAQIKVSNSKLYWLI